MISVVIPLYNRLDTIKRSIKSVLSQTYRDIEVIIVDDGSFDNGLHVVKEINDKRIRIIELGTNHGAGYARNIGMKEAKGDYIAFQDSDDEWYKDKLEKQLNYLTENDVDMVFSSYVQHNLQGGKAVIPSINITDENKSEQIIKILSNNNIIGTPTILMKKQVYEMVGGFDIRFPKLEDYDYAIRLAKCCRIGFIREPLLDAYIQKNSLSNREGDDEALYMIMKKHFDFVDKECFCNRLLFSGYFGKGRNICLDKIDGVGLYEKDTCKDIIIQVLYKEYKKVIELRSADYKLFVAKVKDRDFAIYGTGKIGKKVYDMLKERNLRPVFFVVTKREKGIVSLSDIPVIEVDEVKDKSLAIIVAVGKKYRNEIYNMLDRKGFTSFSAYEPY